MGPSKSPRNVSLFTVSFYGMVGRFDLSRLTELVRIDLRVSERSH